MQFHPIFFYFVDLAAHLIFSTPQSSAYDSYLLSFHTSSRHYYYDAAIIGKGTTNRLYHCSDRNHVCLRVGRMGPSLRLLHRWWDFDRLSATSKQSLCKIDVICVCLKLQHPPFFFIFHSLSLSSATMYIPAIKHPFCLIRFSLSCSEGRVCCVDKAHSTHTNSLSRPPSLAWFFPIGNGSKERNRGNALAPSADLFLLAALERHRTAN